MQLMIDIPEKLYNRMKTYQGLDDTYMAVKHGTPLPKGHERLFDERDIVNGNYEIIGNKLYEIEPIIEAERNEEENVSLQT